MGRIKGVTRAQSEEKIWKAALKCIGAYGDQGTSFQRVAAEAGVSAGLVVRHFGTRDEIYPKVLEYVIDEARKQTASELKSEGSATERLKSYFRVSVEFFRATPERARIYVLMYHRATIDERFRKICSEVRDVAVKRIEGILAEGERAGEFKIKNRALAARMIHSSTIGLMISVMATEQMHSDSVLTQELENMVLSWIEPRQ